MKDFNYNDYLKNNPLLKENSISNEQADEIARQAEDWNDAVLQLEDMGMSFRQASVVASQYHQEPFEGKDPEGKYWDNSATYNERNSYDGDLYENEDADITKTRKLQSIINHLQQAQDELNALGDEDDEYDSGESPYNEMGFSLDDMLVELNSELSQNNI